MIRNHAMFRCAKYISIKYLAARSLCEYYILHTSIFQAFTNLWNTRPTGLLKPRWIACTANTLLLFFQLHQKFVRDLQIAYVSTKKKTYYPFFRVVKKEHKKVEKKIKNGIKKLLEILNYPDLGYDNRETILNYN